MRFSGIVQRLADLGDPEPEDKAIKKYLCVVRPRYKQLVISMEAFVGLSKLSIEEVTGTLKTSDDAEAETPPPSTPATEKLLLTKEEWLEKYKQEDSGRGGSTSGSGGWGNRHGKPRGRGGRNNPESCSSTRPPRANRDNECKRCSKMGNWAQDCHRKLKVSAQTHVAQDDEPTLPFAHASVGDESPRSISTTAATIVPPSCRIELEEPKVFVVLDSPSDQDQK